jgi:hypothetical protein
MSCSRLQHLNDRRQRYRKADGVPYGNDKRDGDSVTDRTVGKREVSKMEELKEETGR